MSTATEASLHVIAVAIHQLQDSESFYFAKAVSVLFFVVLMSRVLTSLFSDDCRVAPSTARQLRVLVFRVLRQFAPFPRHAAFIMDGNRRWARIHGESDTAGHPRGSDKLMSALRWCYEADIEAVTVYAFSIENFKRPSHEVCSIMELAETKFGNMLQNSDVVHAYQFRVRVLGNLNRLNPKLRTVMRKAIRATEHYQKRTLNICFAYTARHEIARAIFLASAQTSEQFPSPLRLESQLREREIERHLMAEDSCPDVVVRTSGETRLSDFLLWQSAFAHVVFLPVLWPEFNVVHFLSVLLSYQRAYQGIARARAVYRANFGVVLEEHRSLSRKQDVLEVIQCNQ
eukprot:CAMPEP_0185848464 /NCGR_PEP_ID=MMETSP1354-20130828/3327_1 /TAXON_ID=708628 /ORGANISM="Erythrolobus madagascarensis, Strain CCMP3276" /LENGTH=343 /DNA_ID=CAMNT_0028548857 /DNA_START=111 /DNA_END=1142 /DNA_ORIENTATION=+